MASMISSPLFIRVAESMVIFAPMVQLGCFRASAAVTCSSSSKLRPKNGPPEQVSSSRRTSPRSRQPCKHWKMALCSESTGTISAPVSRAADITSSPAHTSVSLLARAMRFFSMMAASVGASPTLPITAVTTVSASGSVAAAVRPSGPSITSMPVPRRRSRSSLAAAGSYSTARRGLNCRACCSSRSTCRLAVSAATESPSSCATASVCRPMEPVAPSRDMVFVIDVFLNTASPRPRSSRAPARQRSHCQTDPARRRVPAEAVHSP